MRGNVRVLLVFCVLDYGSPLPTAGTRGPAGPRPVEHGSVARPLEKEFRSFCESKIEMKFPRATAEDTARHA